MLFWAGVRPPLLVLRGVARGEPAPRLQQLGLGRVDRAPSSRCSCLAAVHLRIDRRRASLNVAMGAVAMPLWERLAPYQQNRLLTFLNPEVDPRAAGYHVIQSQVAIGSGGWFGTGYTAGAAEAARVPSRAAHRLHLSRRRRGAGLHRRDARAGALPAAVPALLRIAGARTTRSAAWWPSASSGCCSPTCSRTSA